MSESYDEFVSELVSRFKPRFFREDGHITGVEEWEQAGEEIREFLTEYGNPDALTYLAKEMNERPSWYFDKSGPPQLIAGLALEIAVEILYAA